MNSSEYNKFIQGKIEAAKKFGFEPSFMPGGLFDYQQYAVNWACEIGKAGVFLDTGLGKTRIQCAVAENIVRQTNRPVLILAPLAVAGQTILEAEMTGVNVAYCRHQSQIQLGVNIANYEMLKHFDPGVFAGVVLDESSILKNFTGKTKREILSAFRDTPYKLACTATPSPNDHLELGNHAQFLDVMRSNEMISRYFINDTMSAGSYRLKHHAKGDFWQWVASWAISMTHPADMGFTVTGFDLPPLNIHTHIVSTESLGTTEGQLFRDVKLSATDLHRELRATAPLRAGRVAEIISGDKPWLIWCNTNYEAEALARVVDAVEVRGDMKPEQKEERLLGFSAGEFPRLLTKPSIAGFGMNWQHCSDIVFTGLSYSYEMFYQAIRRCWRYGQKQPVNVHVVLADSEIAILDNIREKEEKHRDMQQEMSRAISTNHKTKKYAVGNTVKNKKTGADWEIVNGDCVQAMQEMPEAFVDLSVYSPPFSNLYIYSDSIYDMGNTRDHSEFFEQYRHAAEQLYRITRDGRLTVIHCKDLPLYKNRDGAAGLYDFPGECIRMYESAGWTYHSRVTIWKDPVIEMQRTKNHGLLYKQLCKDSAASRQGMADYLIILRKWGDESKWDPVTRGKERFFDYIGSSKPGAKDIAKGRDAIERKRLYSINVWQRYASPVWFDIQQTNVLNIKQAREEKDEKHIAPLQLDVIERAIELWSNPGDLVFSPFAGLGSEGYVALKMGRRFLGVELKESYYDVAIKNLQSAKQEQTDLFAEAI